MKFKLIGFCVACSLALQAASIQNGDFSSGLTGWTVSGNVSPSGNPTTGLVNVLPDNTVWNPSATFPLPNPLTGGNYAEISNSPNVNTVPTIDFSSLSTSLYYVTPGGGGTLSFIYNLLTDEFPTGADYAIFSVLSSTNTVLFSQTYPISAINQDGGCTEVAAPDGTTICAASGWINQNFSLAAFEGQNVKFDFSVFDAVSVDTPDNGFDTALLLANVQGTGLGEPVFTAAPEPATFVFGGSALLALYLRRRASRA